MLATRWLTALLLLAACARTQDFHEKVATFEAQSGAAAARARTCAGELEAIARQHPREASRALAPHLGDVEAQPSAALATRVAELEAARRTIVLAKMEGVVALERAVYAMAAVRQLEAALCESRDVATTLAGLARPTPPAVVARQSDRPR